MSADNDSKSTFLVEVKFQRNATWQGTVKWMEEKKTQDFRSMLELIKLIDETLHNSDEEKISWEK